MAWGISPDGQKYTTRIAAVVGTSAVSPGASAVAQVTVTEQFTQFWDAVQSNFYNVMICDSGGNALAHTRDGSSSYAGRIAQFRFSVTVPASAPAGALVVVYLHVGTASTVTADPSTGALTSTISANLMAALSTSPGAHMTPSRSGSWSQSTASATPQAVEAFGIMANESRPLVIELGARFLYAVGDLYHGSEIVDDLDYVYAAASGSGSVGSHRVWLTPNGPVHYCLCACSSGNSLVTIRYRWSSFSNIEEHVVRLIGIAPTV